MIVNFKKILALILISSLLGFAYNYFSPKGIPIIKEERIVKFEIEESQIDNFKLSQKQSVDNNKEKTAQTIIDAKSTTKEKQKEITPVSTQPVAIKIKRAYQLYHQGIKFIDARPIDEFAEGHIKGAINIPFYGSENYDAILKQISKDEIIVTYCSGEDCDLSILLGDELFAKGYKKVFVFFGGWNDWLKNNYPIEKK
jgi:rhodanese-related sulfurtransferase